MNKNLLEQEIVGNVRRRELDGGLKVVYCFGNIIVSDNGAITITSRMSSRWEHWKVFPTERAEPFWMFGKVLDAAATRDVSVLDYYFRWALAHGYEFMKSTFRTWESYCE